MGKKTKLGKTRLDKFYHLAKEQGYRSRASFKLVQLNKKYDLLSKAKVVLDLCAAPGSWSQVAVKYLPVQSIVIAVDLVPIKPIKNVICLQEDITTDKCKTAIKQQLKTWKVDLVLNDGAPNVGGAWSKDAYSQAELSLLSLKLATNFLRAGGNYVTKVFRSSDYNALLWVFNQMFKRVESTKPQASRNESAEIFVVCLGYLAPKKIDPKLLDPKFVFEELDLNPAKKANIMQKQKPNQRHRDGYEVGRTVLYKEMSATDFVRCEDALDVLTDHNKIVFTEEGDDETLLEHTKTTEEIKVCLNDLRVLGKADFRSILRWRDAMKKVLGVVEEGGAEGEGGDDADGEEEDEEMKAANEIGELTKKAVSREKRKKRKEREKRAKYQRRIDLKMVDPNDVLETSEELGLFSMKKVRTEEDLEAMEDGTQQADDLYDSDRVSSESEVEESSDSELDDEDLTPQDRRRIMTEREMDLLYTEYLARTGQTKKRERKGKKEKRAVDPDSVFRNGEMIEGSFVPDMTRDPLIDSDDDDETGDHPLLDALVDKDDGKDDKDANKAADKKAAMLWFDQPIFKELNWRSQGGTDAQEKATRAPKAAHGPAPMPPAGTKRKLGGAGAEGVAAGEGEGDTKTRAQKREDEGFEEVKADSSDTDSSDYSEDEADEAELAALGSLLKRKKIRKEDLIDECYHRYSFNDTNQAPVWFQDAEKKYNKRILPITKEMVEEQKRKMMEIAARPIKKVAEAKARKKLKAVKAHQRMSNKAEAVTNDTDMDEKAKLRALQKLYDKGVAVKRPRSVTVVAKKGKSSVGRKGVKVVDKRMKKDMKSTERMGTHNFKKGAKGKIAAKIRKKNKPKPVRK